MPFNCTFKKGINSHFKSCIDGENLVRQLFLRGGSKLRHDFPGPREKRVYDPGAPSLADLLVHEFFFL